MKATAPNSRRSALRGRLAAALAALGAGAALLLSPGLAAAETARPADSFVDSIGVDTHTSYDDTPYGEDFATVEQRLAELGVRHVREDLVSESPDQYERLRALAGIGIHSTLILGDPNNGVEGLEELLSTMRTELGGTAEAVEGPNEFDSRGGADWAARLADYQQRLYTSVKSDPALAALPVVGPSIVQKRNQEALGDISGSLDYGNVHSYPNGSFPESNVDSYLQRAALNSAGKPVIATETGYNTAIATTEEHQPVSEEAMAVYMPRLYLEYFRRGFARTFSYELLDEHANDGHDEVEANFGLLHNDLSPKPSFEALRNTISILSDPGPGFAPASLEYDLGGDRADLHQLLLQKRDGSFYLALWRAESVWDTASRSATAAHEGTVTVDLKRSLTSAEEFVPSDSAAPVASLPAGQNPLPVQVGAKVVVLRLVAGPAHRTGRIKLWLSKRSAAPGERVLVKGRLPKQAAGRARRVKVQRWQGHGWQTVGQSRARRSGSFHKKIRLPAGERRGSRLRLRVVARQSKPSRPVRVHIAR